MLFEPIQSLPLLMCSYCNASGFLLWRRCKECGGMAMGYFWHNRWLYWRYPLTRYNLQLERSRRIFNRLRRIIVFLLGVNFLLWAGWSGYRGVLRGDPTSLLNGKDFYRGVFMLFLGVVCFSYFFYRRFHDKRLVDLVEHYDYRDNAALYSPVVAIPSWTQAKKIPRRQRHNVAETFTDEALLILSDTYRLADKLGSITLTPLHLFYSLLTLNQISGIFIRLGIPISSIQQKIGPALKQAGGTGGRALAITDDVRQILFHAYEEAYQAHQEYVSVTDLLLATVRQAPALQDLLYDFGIDKQKLTNVVEWVRIRERLYRSYRKFQQAARHRSKHGMDRAMTAVATPYLNQFSDDVTLLAQLGHTSPCVARDKEMAEVFRIVEGGQQNVILVGDYGVGKKSIIEGIADRMVQDDVPDRLKDKRLIRLSVSSLLAGTTPSGAVERLINIMREIARAGNIILLIHNIHELIGVSAGGQSESLDVAGTLADYLTGGRFMTIATTTTEAHARYIANSKLSTVFTKVEILEMSEDQAIQVLESKVGYIEYKNHIFFSYESIAKAVQLAKRFVHDVLLPGSALEIMSEAASFTHNKKGKDTLVTGEEVAVVVAEKTKIPVTTVSADETTKLLHLEETMHQRVIGQDEAVSLVANSLRRARAQIRATTKPIANFLFLGPTGVGKTELTKTIAEVYFGGENRMVRLDMSEYQDKTSIYRLIGAPGEKGTGILTEAIRRNPFALLLLDEIEKADKDVLNLFLQVMDDGRLTDSTGRVVDFTNIILIATSNAGTSYVQEQLHAGLSPEAIKERLLHGELKQYFRPEFLNRFDGIVLFKPLGQNDIKQIAALMLKRVARDLEQKGIELKVTEPALEYFASIGFDPDFGARPMRRVVQERVENALAELLLSGKLQRRSVVIIGAEGKIEVK